MDMRCQTAEFLHRIEVFLRNIAVDEALSLYKNVFHQLLLSLGIIYGQKEKTEVADTPTTTVSEVAESTTAAAAESTTAAPETTTSANVTVPAGATVQQDANGNWALMNNGATVNTFTGIASNDFGNWYIENGVVNFNFSGKVVFNGVTYDIENGKVVS